MSRSFLLRWTNPLSEQSAPFTRGRFPAAFKAGLSAPVRALFKIREKLAQSNAQAQRDHHLQPLGEGGRTVLTQPTAVSRPNGARLAPDLLNQLRPRLPKHDADNQDQSIRALLR